jgi:predicted transcriptional regulator
MGASDDTARRLDQVAERRARADQLMAQGLRAAAHSDAASIAHAAACFTVAAALRGDARFLP